jgi:hypothetical protein
MAASLCVSAQQLAALQINEVEPGTGGTGYRFELRVGRILILIVEGMLNVEVGIRASENKRSHSSHTTSNSALAKADLLRSWHGPPRSPRQTGSICQKGGAAGQDRSECPTRLNRKMLARQTGRSGWSTAPGASRLANARLSFAISRHPVVGMFKSLLGWIVATLDYDSAR